MSGSLPDLREWQESVASILSLAIPANYHSVQACSYAVGASHVAPGWRFLPEIWLQRGRVFRIKSLPTHMVYF